MNAPSRMSRKAKCNIKTAHFSLRSKRYLKMFPIKLIAIKTIKSSNHQALYIQILAVSVLYQLSIKVPKAMAVGYSIKSRAVSRVENRTLLSWSFINYIFFFRLQIYSLSKKFFDQLSFKN